MRHGKVQTRSPNLGLPRRIRNGIAHLGIGSALAAPALLSLPVTEAMSAPSTVISIGRGLDSYQAHTQAQMDVL